MAFIGVDLDGVLADTMGLYCELFNETYGDGKYHDDLFTTFYPMTKDRVKGWDFFKNWGMTTDIGMKMFLTCWENFDKLLPTETELDKKLGSLKEMGHQISIITAEQKDSIPYIYEWLHLHNIPYDTITFIFNGQPKMLYLTDVLIDDNPHTAEVCAEKWLTKKMILYDQPWNKHVKEAPNVPRAYSWNEIIEKHLKSLNNTNW